MKEEDSKGAFTQGDLCVSLLDFFHAGTETSSTSMKWVILLLTLYEVQDFSKQHQLT